MSVITHAQKNEIEAWELPWRYTEALPDRCLITCRRLGRVVLFAKHAVEVFLRNRSVVE